MKDLFQPLNFSCGVSLKNRFMLAPLTNTQSHTDGRLSDDEYHWLTMRAEGGFGLTMTCAAHVQAVGQGFPGQLGVFGDEHLEGLSRLANGIKSQDSLAVVQLHHAGMRSPAELIGQAPVCPSDNVETAAVGLSTAVGLSRSLLLLARSSSSVRGGGVCRGGRPFNFLCFSSVD